MRDIVFSLFHKNKLNSDSNEALNYIYERKC